MLMVYGARTFLPFGFGLLLSIFFSFLFFDNDVLNNHKSRENLKTCSFATPESKVENLERNFIDSSANWKVIVKKTTNMQNPPSQPGKVNRARFAATELGIREKLIVILLSQSSLSVSLNSYIAPHVPKIHIFAENSRIDTEMNSLSNLTPYRPNGQHAHVHVLNSIFNLTFHENYDWFFLMSDTTYINPFALKRLVASLDWNNPQAMGHLSPHGHCVFQGGILLSNPAVQLLIQERHLCNSIVTNSDQSAFEMCIHRATNLTCEEFVQGHKHRWWRFEESSEAGSAIHDRVRWFSSSREFNSSLSVSPLLSDMDAQALHEHFVRVEIDRVDAKMQELTENMDKFEHTTEEGPSWPVGLPSENKPPNRYQVSTWEFFTETELFKNERQQNFRPLVGNDALDIQEVLKEARHLIEALSYKEEQDDEPFDSTKMEFIRLRNGYRLFNPSRGMEYIVDLEYHKIVDNIFLNPRLNSKFASAGSEVTIIKRVHLCRPIYSTELVNSVPYVKEDTDITLVVPIEDAIHLPVITHFLQRHAKLCSGALADSRQTRLVIAARGIDAAAAHKISAELNDLKIRCKAWHIETNLLLLKPINNINNRMVEMVAMEEAVDHYGQQMIYVLLSPYSDYQIEFLDRIRINTIKHFQVFFPIPFVEFAPFVRNAKLDKNSLKVESKQGAEDRIKLAFEKQQKQSSKPVLVHKDNGFFDTKDFTSFSAYGADFLIQLQQFLDKENTENLNDIPDQEDVEKASRQKRGSSLDLVQLFMGKQSPLHVLRAIEPSLILRYHQKHCDPVEMKVSDLARCLATLKQSFGTKAQLANFVFGNESFK